MNLKSDFTKDELLLQVEKLKAEIKSLKKHTKLGLVWEDKLDAEVLKCKNNLPILQEVKDKVIGKNKNKPTNLIIEGDNYHALSILNYTHRGSIDVIYIDPPFNTGARDWLYNNDYVDKNDAYRHSKWLSLMQNRLKLAQNLLTSKGFFICAIDHHELAHSILLCNSVFGYNNRRAIISVTHKPEGRNLSQSFSPTIEFMLVYSKNQYINQFIIDNEKKADFLLEDSIGKYRWNNYLRTGGGKPNLRINKPSCWYPIFVSKDLQHISTKPIEGYHKIFPITRKKEERTWKTSLGTFKEKLSVDEISAQYSDGAICIFEKFREKQIIKTHWHEPKYSNTIYGTKLLQKIIGENKFDFPKSLYTLKDILKITSKKNSIILDFFAGSGTTGHAVMELNQEDGGNRQSILCTNNENQIAEKVTYLRMKKVIEGYHEYEDSNKPFVEGIPANLRYFKTHFINTDDKISKISDKKKLELSHQAGHIIALKENTFNEVEHNNYYQIFTNNNNDKYVAIYFKENLKELKNLEAKILDKPEVKLYIFSYSISDYETEYEQYDHIEVKNIPTPILNIYKSLN